MKANKLLPMPSQTARISFILILALTICLSQQAIYQAPGVWPPSEAHLIAVVHQRGTLDSTFLFESAPPAHARIQGAYLAEEDSGSTGSINALQFKTLEADAPLTISWIEASSASHPVTGLFLSYSTERAYDFGHQGETWTHSNSEAEIPGGTWETNIYHFYIAHDQIDVVTCNFEIQYKGFVRAVIVNDHNYGGFGSSHNINVPDEEDTISSNYGKSVFLQADMLNVVTIIMKNGGLFSSFEFTNCSPGPIFTTYQSDQATVHEEDIVGPSAPTLTAMGSPTLRQESDSVAIDCETGYLLDEGGCVSKCMDSENVFYTGKCMGDEDNSYSIQYESSSVDGGVLSLEIYFDFDVSQYAPMVYLAAYEQFVSGGLLLMSQQQGGEINSPTLWVGEEGQTSETLQFTFQPFSHSSLASIYFFQKITDISRQYQIYSQYDDSISYGTLGQTLNFEEGSMPRVILFYLGCRTSPCNIILESNGYVQLLVDEYYPKLFADIGNERSLTIQDDWSSGSGSEYDYHKIELQLLSPTSLNIQITGDFEIFTNGPVAGHIMYDTSTLTSIDCSGFSNCNACNSEECIFCGVTDDETLYLAEDRQSCVDPNSCNLVNNNTYSCVTECLDTNFDLIEENGFCALTEESEEDGVSCETGQFYFILARSCYDCPTGCSSCFAYNKCDACEPNYVLRDVHCVPDYSYSLNLQTSATQYYCEDIVIEAQLLRYNPVTGVTKQLKYGTGYTHSVEITGSEASQNEDIDQIVEDSNARKLVIPSSLLEIGMALQFNSTYTSTSLKPEISVTSQVITVNVLADLAISIEGSPTIDIKQNEALTVKGYLQSGCNRQATDLDISWSQISGDDVEGTESSVTPLWLNFDSCELDASSTYEYRLTVSDKSGKETKTADIEIQTATEFVSFDVDILKGNRQHVFSQPLIITGDVIKNQPLCPSTDVGDFVFSCEKSGSACADSESVFGSKETNSITIPENYFAENDVIEITLAVTISGETKSKTVTITMKDADIIPIELSCSSTKSCAKYINDGAYTFTALTPTLSTTKGLTYQWTVSESSISKVKYLNSLKLLKNELTISDSITIEVVVTQTSTSREGRASIVLASNTPPSGGSLSVSPITGDALSTDFTLTAPSWTDGDAPLTYLFYYKLPSQSQRVKIGQRQKINSITTQLPGGQTASTTVTIYVDVYDGLNAISTTSTSVIISSSFASIDALTSSVTSLITSTTKLDPYRSLNKLQLASNTIRYQEENFESEQSPTYINNLIKTKTLVLSKLRESAANILEDEESQQMMYEALDSSSKSVKFNNFDSQQLTRDILDEELKASDENILISPENSRKLSNVLDNMLSYSAEEDCEISNEFSISLKERTQKYLQKISNSNLAQQSPNEDPFIQTTELFDVLLIKVTPSELSEKTLQSQDDTPEISFEVDLDAFEDDLEEFWIQYYLFKNKVFDCSEEEDEDEEDGSRRLLAENDKKGDVGLKFRDKDGNDVKKDVKVKVKSESGSQCPASCDCSDPEKYECEDLDLFDVEKQIARIFEASNFGLIGNFDALLSFQFWKSAVFWAIIVFTLWFFISMILIIKKLKDYDSLEGFLTSSIRTRKKALLVILLITHPLFGIYYYINPKIIKQNRALLYYCKMILVLAYVAIFGDLQKATENEYQFKIYLIFIPFITYVPIFKILTMLVENPEKTDEHKLTKCKRFKVKFGLFMTIAVIVGSYVIILTISAQKSAAWQRDFAINFAIVAFLDIIFNPIGAFATSLAAYAYYRNRKDKMGKITKKVSEKLIGEEMLKIMENVKEFGRGVTYMLSGKDKKEIIGEQPEEKDIEAQDKNEEGDHTPKPQEKDHSDHDGSDKEPKDLKKGEDSPQNEQEIKNLPETKDELNKLSENKHETDIEEINLEPKHEKSAEEDPKSLHSKSKSEKSVDSKIEEKEKPKEASQSIAKEPKSLHLEDIEQKQLKSNEQERQDNNYHQEKPNSLHLISQSLENSDIKDNHEVEVKPEKASISFKEKQSSIHSMEQSHDKAQELDMDIQNVAEKEHSELEIKDLQDFRVQIEEQQQEPVNEKSQSFIKNVDEDSNLDKSIKVQNIRNDVRLKTEIPTRIDRANIANKPLVFKNKFYK